MIDCSNCGDKFRCGIADGHDDCWCFHKPKKNLHGQKCICEKCLEQIK